MIGKIDLFLKKHYLLNTLSPYFNKLFYDSNFNCNGTSSTLKTFFIYKKDQNQGNKEK